MDFATFLPYARRGDARPPPSVWPPPAKAPLPPFPPVTAERDGRVVWADGPYDADLPFVPAAEPAMDFHRGNFDVEIPGITPLPGDSQDSPSLTLTWFTPRRPLDQQTLLFEHYAHVDGYTHVVLSIPQCKNWNVSIDALVLTAALAKTYGQYVIVNVFGGDGESWEDVQPWLDALVAAKAVDILCVAWQADQHYSPMDLTAITYQVNDYARAHGLKVALHWVNDACAWWSPADAPKPNTCEVYGICNRFSYQQVMTGVVDYHYMQVYTEATVNGIQESEAKVLQSLTSQKLVASEYCAQAQFDNAPLPPRTELQGDTLGYLMVCARGYGRVMDGGYLNGARRPDGRVL